MFNKAEYWANRKEDKRGQGEDLLEHKLAKDSEGKDRTSNVTIIRVKGRNLAMSRLERRNMGVRTKKV